VCASIGGAATVPRRTTLLKRSSVATS
jgi:hypothetical protein